MTRIPFMLLRLFTEIPGPSRIFPLSLPLYTYLLPVTCALSLILSGCAQPGTMLTGGPKDEKPPEVISSIPPNFSKRFNSDRIEITFNEYFKLKDIAKKMVVSPPMSKKPEFKIKGKSLEIILKDSLVPDRTYAINFGDGLVDLNEENAIKNFQFVFSTGDRIDSLQAGGKVVLAFDGKPAEDILVMLYDENTDSLPLKTIPLYISRTDKEGRFTLKNLAGGSYKIFALKDGNTNYLFDQPDEAVAFLDSLITPTVMEVTVQDTLPSAADSAAIVKDSLNPVVPPADTLIKKTVYKFSPDSLELRLFNEVRPIQYLKSADRLRKDQIRFIFNEKIDSLAFELLDLPGDSMAVALEWSGDADTVDFWIRNPSVAARDSILAILDYPALDSLERPMMKTDTVRLRFRALPKPASTPKKEFTVSVSVESSKILEFGQQLIFTTSLPYVQIDTSLIHLVSGKDSVSRPVPYTLTPDTLRGLALNGTQVIQAHPRILRLAAGFAADTAYRLTLRPGAFRDAEGHKNDSTDIRFKMKNRDQYGLIKITLPDLAGPAVIELLDGRSKVVASRQMNAPGDAVFDLMAPGKYTARLIFDPNQNGRWDTGRYILHLQPEKVITFSKELNLKANWEVVETWKWENL